MDLSIRLAKKILADARVDDSHGAHHALQVLAHAEEMLACEMPPLSHTQSLNVKLAALLHDLDDRKYFPKNKNYENARFVLDKVLPEAHDEHITVLEMIKLVSTTSNGNAIDGEIAHWMFYPRFADRLEAIGPVGVERCLAYSQHKKRPLFTPNTMRPRSENELWKVATAERFALYLARKESDSFIDHFYDKLLHIGTLQALGYPTNPYVVREATLRHQYMVDYILSFDFT